MAGEPRAPRGPGPPVVGPVEPDVPLADTLVEAEARLSAEVDAIRSQQAALSSRLEAAETSLATLHDAGASCPVCLRELDDDSRDRAEHLHRTNLEAVRNDLAALDDASVARVLDTVRRLAREAATLGPPPAAPDVDDLDARIEAEAAALAVLEAAIAGQREAELKAQAMLPGWRRSANDIAAADALTEQYRAEALLEAGKAALHQTVTAVLGRQLEPLAAEVNRRWEAVFPDRPNLHLTPDGELSRVIDGAPLEFGAFSAGEQTVAKLMMRLTTLLATTTVPFCWIDEPLEHLDPVSRQLVGSTLAHLSAAGGLEQISSPPTRSPSPAAWQSSSRDACGSSTSGRSRPADPPRRREMRVSYHPGKRGGRGPMASTSGLVRPRDGTATQLTCVECGTPICPSCMVRTSVGLICPDDVSEPVGPRIGAGGRRPVVAILVTAALVAVAVVVGIRSFGSSEPAPEPLAESVTRTALDDEVVVGAYTVRITRFECGARRLGEAPTLRVAEGRFCVAHLTVRRSGPAADTFNAAEQELTDGSRRFAPALKVVPGSPPSTLKIDGSSELYNLRLTEGIEFRGMLVYDLPETSTPTELLFHDGPNNLVARVRLPS